MSFLQPLLLLGLPLMLVPVIIHLIHMLRRKQIPWAAMIFLEAAQKMNKGFSRLRQYLILAFRVLAVATLILAAGRPLAGGLLGLTGGAPDSVIILLDRSASMEERLLSTGTSKRAAALQNLAAAVRDAYGKRSSLTLIDSATLTPVIVENAEALTGLPQAGATATAADVPALLQAALDYITTNDTGRTDVWLVSDQRQSDWNATGGRWTALRDAFATLDGVRLQLLSYPEASGTDMGVTVEKLERREVSGNNELLLDIRVHCNEAVAGTVPLPLRVVVNGTGSTLEAQFKGTELLLQGQTIPLDQNTVRGWGRVELPADGSPANNVFHFVFDDPPALKAAVVSDDEAVSHPLEAALTAQAEPTRTYECTVLPVARAVEIAWEETALVVWQGAIPAADSALARQLEAHLEAGRCLLFLPPQAPDDHAFAGIRWTDWQGTEAGGGKPALVEWWRNDTGPLAATLAGAALPVGEVEAQRWCGIEGEAIPLARLGEDAGNAPLLVRAGRQGGGDAWFLTSLPGSGATNLARDGVVLFALLHRALNQGAAALGNARQRIAGTTALGSDASQWQRLDVEDPDAVLSSNRPLQAGVLRLPAANQEQPEMLVALNRAPEEDAPQTLATASLEQLFTGLDWRLIERSLENEKSLTSEVWRTFLFLMAAAIVIEALLCMPGKRQPSTLEPR